MRYVKRVAWIVIVINVAAASRGRAQEPPVGQEAPTASAQQAR